MTAVRAIQERINDAEADQADSDDDFVGAFDDEEGAESDADEQEDEIDQDIVVSPSQVSFICPLVLKSITRLLDGLMLPPLRPNHARLHTNSLIQLGR